MRNSEFFRTAPVWWWLWFAVGAGFWAVVIYVAGHFVAKWW